MADETLAAELLEAIRQRVLQEHPEMEGAEVTVARHQHPPEAPAVAAKVGLAVTQPPAESHYVVTIRKEVQAEDGVTLPLVVRVTVDAQGREIRRKSAR